ncbi:MAG: hypothetical protein ACTHMC_25635 [Pseudobacter sp.]|uniref:hypothetical protein n=1 Tax=Pseudobacter sp. TaxID=2045420 RepID=UPI003F7E442E
MSINIFNNNSPYFQYRWFIIMFLVVASVMVFHDLTGRRMFAFSEQQHWSAKGPEHHK